jgi:hypothetical protein
MIDEFEILDDINNQFVNVNLEENNYSSLKYLIIYLILLILYFF